MSARRSTGSFQASLIEALSDSDITRLEQRAEHKRLKKADRIVSLVFHRDGERVRNFRRSWLSACKAAGVPGRILHDFRRTAVRNLERASVPRSSAMAMVGHKTESIYRRYAIVDAGALRDAAEKIDRIAAGVIGEQHGQPVERNRRFGVASDGPQRDTNRDAQAVSAVGGVR